MGDEICRWENCGRGAENGRLYCGNHPPSLGINMTKYEGDPSLPDYAEEGPTSSGESYEESHPSEGDPPIIIGGKGSENP